MRLYDYLKLKNRDYDTYDKDFDVVVTVVCPDDNYHDDPYDQFCDGLCKLVSVLDEISEYEVSVNWCELVRENAWRFRAFSARHWFRVPEDDDDFVEKWIKKFHLLIAGYANEEIYPELVDLISGMKGV